MPLPRSLRHHPLLNKLGYVDPPGGGPWTLAASQAYCRQLTRTHYENFTVARWLWPRPLRQPLADLYAYCRWADDLADESGDPAASLEWLDWWRDQLHACWEGKADHPVFIALAATRQRFPLSRPPFLDLLRAFRQDQVQTRYDTWDELLEYCRGSANPVGRLVLELAECRSEQRDRWSDAICTGLQLANFCQDVAVDARRGRIYLPRQIWDGREWDERLFAAAAPTPELRDVVRESVRVATSRLEEGRPLLNEGPRWLRRNLRLFWEGGQAILQAIKRRGYDVWTERPRVGTRTKLWLLARGLLS